jgi:hypothetical protein
MVPEIQLDETEATLLARAFDADRGDLPREAAEILLKARFPASDLKRMQDLGELAQKGALTASQRREAEAYDRVGLVIELLQSKARRSIASQN